MNHRDDEAGKAETEGAADLCNPHPAIKGVTVRSRIGAKLTTIDPIGARRCVEERDPADDPEARGIKPPVPGITLTLEQPEQSQAQDKPMTILVQVLLALGVGIIWALL